MASAPVCTAASVAQVGLVWVARAFLVLGVCVAAILVVVVIRVSITATFRQKEEGKAGESALETTWFLRGKVSILYTLYSIFLF